MYIYSSLFSLIADMINCHEYDLDFFCNCFLICEYEQEYIQSLPDDHLIELISQSKIGISSTHARLHVNQIKTAIAAMDKIHSILYLVHKPFCSRFFNRPNKPIGWDEIEDFFLARMSTPCRFDDNQDPRLTLILQLKELKMVWELR
jgi:hypothetical protein